jgi:hypothetical protein
MYLRTATARGLLLIAIGFYPTATSQKRGNWNTVMEFGIKDTQ